MTSPLNPTSYPARPVILIPGGLPNGNPFEVLINALCATGKYKFTDYYRVEQEAEFLAKTEANPPNLYAILFKDKYAHPKVEAGEIARLKKIVHQQHPNFPKMNFLTYSKGTNDFRAHLQNIPSPKESDIGDVSFLGGPLWGAPIVTTGLLIIETLARNFNLPIRFVHEYPVDRIVRPTLESLRPDIPFLDFHSNKFLHSLNNWGNLIRERNLMESLTVIGGEGRALLDGIMGSGFKISQLMGDTLIPTANILHPLAMNYLLTGPDDLHKTLKSNEIAIAKIIEIFAGIPMPSHLEEKLRLVFPPQIRQTSLPRFGDLFSVLTASVLGSVVALIGFINKMTGWPESIFNKHVLFGPDKPKILERKMPSSTQPTEFSKAS